MRAPVGSFEDASPAVDRIDLLTPPVARAVSAGWGGVPADQIVCRVSFAPVDTALAETGMEYGGVTPVGLPDAWPVLIDPAVAGEEFVLIGSGRRRGKLIVPGKALAMLPNAVLVEGLGV
ncbi:YbaK/EbsC family protein [Streptomyces sp. 24-1644]|uniref:YbaK/EbsC family protein n=1 Tax=Streptomyces sp. 24-1644 TaxID=3457315 RepID=UPI003FA71F27